MQEINNNQVTKTVNIISQFMISETIIISQTDILKRQS